MSKYQCEGTLELCLCSIIIIEMFLSRLISFSDWKTEAAEQQCVRILRGGAAEWRENAWSWCSSNFPTRVVLWKGPGESVGTDVMLIGVIQTLINNNCFRDRMRAKMLWLRLIRGSGIFGTPKTNSNSTEMLKLLLGEFWTLPLRLVIASTKLRACMCCYSFWQILQIFRQVSKCES